MKELEDFVFSNADDLICITSTLSSEIKKVSQRDTRQSL